MRPGLSIAPCKASRWFEVRKTWGTWQKPSSSARSFWVSARGRTVDVIEHEHTGREPVDELAPARDVELIEHGHARTRYDFVCVCSELLRQRLHQGARASPRQALELG